LGISKPTVSSALRALVEAGLVREAPDHVQHRTLVERLQERRGRPEITVQLLHFGKDFNQNARMIPAATP